MATPPDAMIRSYGTYPSLALQEGEPADCSPAVAYWNPAFTKFLGLPEAYDKDKAPYNSPQNVPFIVLFNPKEKPKVHCAYVTRPAAARGAKDSGVNTDKTVRGLL